MPLNLGDVNFGVGADTRALERAHTALRRFAREVDSVVARTDRLESSSVSAAVRQERAIRSATLQVENLNASIRRTGASAALIDQNTKALHRLRSAMQSGKLSALDFARAQDRFTASLGATRRSLSDFRTQQANNQLGRFNHLIRDLSSASVLAIGPLSGLGARIAALGSITTRSSLKIAGLFAGISAGVVILYSLIKSALSAAKALEQIEARFRTATESARQANTEFEFVARQALRLGLNLRTAAKEYSSFLAAAKGSNLTLQEQQELFLGVSEASTALRLSNEQQAGAFRALQQIMSKGTVQAEELRGQLGERIPGAFQIAARSMNVTTQQLDKLLKEGKIVSEEFIPRFARQLRAEFGRSAVEASDSLASATNRVSTSWFRFSTALNETTGVGKLATGTLNLLSTSLEGMRQEVQLAGEAYEFMLDMVTLGAASAAKARKELRAAAGEWVPTSAGPDLDIIREGVVALTNAFRVGKISADEFTRALNGIAGETARLRDEQRKALEERIKWAEIIGKRAYDPELRAIEEHLAAIEFGRELTKKAAEERIKWHKQAVEFGWDPEMRAMQEHQDAIKLLAEQEKARVTRIGEYTEFLLKHSYDPERRAVDEHMHAVEQLRKEEIRRFEEASAGARQFASIVSSGFTQGLFAGEKLTDILRNVARSLAQAITQAVIFNSIMRGLGYGTGPVPGPIPNPLNSPPRQSGGRVKAGQPYTVGETGKELFIPGQDGYVMPHRASMGGGGGIFIEYVDARGADVEAVERLRQIAGTIEQNASARAVAQVAQHKSRGGRRL